MFGMKSATILFKKTLSWIDDIYKLKYQDQSLHQTILQQVKVALKNKTSSSTNGEGHKTILQCPWGFYHTTIWTWKTHYKMSSPRQYFERKGHKVKSQYPMFSGAPYGSFMLKWCMSYCTVAIILHPWYNLDSFTLELFTCLREDDL